VRGLALIVTAQERKDIEGIDLDEIRFRNVNNAFNGEKSSDAEVSDEESNNSEKQIEPEEEFFDEQNNKEDQVVNIEETGTTNDDENDVEKPNSESEDRCLPATSTGRIRWKPRKLDL